MSPLTKSKSVFSPAEVARALNDPELQANPSLAPLRYAAEQYLATNAHDPSTISRPSTDPVSVQRVMINVRWDTDYPVIRRLVRWVGVIDGHEVTKAYRSPARARRKAEKILRALS